jgi:hypothetical protein
LGWFAGLHRSYGNSISPYKANPIPQPRSGDAKRVSGSP